MKSPPKEAITKALAILLESISEEQGFQLVDAAALDSAELETLTGAEEALGIAKSSFVKDIDRLIADIRRRRNSTALIHQLPPEVFITILTHLADAYSLEGKEHRILDLMTVNRIWRDIILNSPQLWTILRSDHPLEFAKQVVERSKAHPLSLIWDTSTSHNLDIDDKEFEGFLELVVQSSSRIRSMNIAMGVKSVRTLRSLLRGSAPQLESLTVKVQPEDTGLANTRQWFTLWQGGPLRELVLHSTGLSDWDSWRLSGLRVLDLSNPTKIPSLNQILRILSTSPLLEQLNLRWFDSLANTPATQEEEINVEGPIELPQLKKIHIEALLRSHCASILSHIRPEVCNSVRIVDRGAASANTLLQETLWREGSETMATLLQIPKASAPARAENSSLSIVIEEEEATIVNQVRIGPGSLSEAEKSTISFAHTDASRATEVLGEFFWTLGFGTPSIRLRLENSSAWRYKPIDLRPWSASLGMLQVKGVHLCRHVLQQLAQQWVRWDGTITWMCPRLSFVELDYRGDIYVYEREDMDGRALLLAVEKRWLGEHDIPPVPQPSRFRVWCDEGQFVTIRERAETIKAIVPSFELH
ncbi:hypothetical protein FRC05_000824 [Tulasnella sp. 425]|nr:hypothetical protein FRC05_000824 [Tulasnella sp. 425]